MTIDEIQELIRDDETRTIELKKSTGELISGMHSLCAFLNTDGGYLLFGITPTSLKIIGQDVTDNTRKEIAGELRKFEPTIDLEVEYAELPDSGGKKVIIMHADPKKYHEEPYVYDGRPYYKVESTTMLMPQVTYNSRLRRRHPEMYKWEDYENVELKLEDFDERAMRNLVKSGVDSGRMESDWLYKSKEEILEDLHLKRNGHYTNAAAVLFGQNLGCYPEFELKMARFVGKDKTEFLDSQVAEGHLFKLLVAGEQFCFKHLNLHGRNSETSMQREEFLEVPYKAVREALLNAFTHREYWDGSVSLAIYDDRVEIYNPGMLPRDFSVEQMQQKHDSHGPNKRLAAILFRGHFVEAWGRGVGLMNDECDLIGAPHPYFVSSREGFRTIFPRKDYQQKPATEATDHTTVQVTTQVTVQVTDQVRMLLEKMSEVPMSTSELRARVGLKNRSHFYKEYISPALAQGYIAQTEPDSPNSPKQKYYLTEKGKALLKQG